MEEMKHAADEGSIWLMFLKSMGYGIGLAGGGVAILFLFPGVRETIERIAMSCFG